MRGISDKTTLLHFKYALQSSGLVDVRIMLHRQQYHILFSHIDSHITKMQTHLHHFSAMHFSSIKDCFIFAIILSTYFIGLLDVREDEYHNIHALSLFLHFCLHLLFIPATQYLAYAFRKKEKYPRNKF